MQIKDSSLTSVSDWLFAGQQQSPDSNDFMQTLSSALGTEHDKTSTAAELVPLLSGNEENNGIALSRSDAMFSVLTQSLMQSLVQSALQTEKTPEQLAAEQQPTAFADGTTPGMADVVDMINPLQHIPLVSQYYREWTGDDMGYVSQVAGGALWGGGVGVATSFLNLGLTSIMGKSPSDYIHQFLTADEAGATATAAVPKTVAPAKAVTS
ncbi:MAG: hypothetical protein CL577_08685 [Alteromonadaceae bacterium]|jgi:hypothetical protein|uniref:hypothetical protein n=1 Tax=Rheinheimera aquimaris TaxID=412437 RepID=UPI000C5FE21E|nr:hypothetical protein [Rheinheimera aquimaris]MBJ92655.1 hypothetical protein [Alteromonadaceae bacterium]HBN90472.1 hypothetical protein [Rheinheimera sp.]